MRERAMPAREMAPRAEPATAGPASPWERIQVVDMLRGFALFGILLVNMALFKVPVSFEHLSATSLVNVPDRLAALAIELLADGKFFTLFSFLFGLGFSIQMIRARRRAGRFVGRYVRRLLVLLVIGLAHVTLIWFGDILVTYALLGLLLVLFRNRSPRALLIWAAALLTSMTLLAVAAMIFVESGRADPAGGTAIERAETQLLASDGEDVERLTAVYDNGSYRDTLVERVSNPAGLVFVMVVQGVPVLAMLLLGLYAGKRGILEDVPAHLTLLRRVRLWGLALGLPLSALMVLAQAKLGLFSALAVQFLNFSLAAPILSMGFAATFVLLAQREKWRVRLAPLGAAGRMALTNYLLQSLICTTLFYGYGFGLYGKVGAAVGLLLTVIIFAAQVAWSAWWLSHFRFGPVEWLWRTLTYGHVQPMSLRTGSLAEEAR